MSEKNIYQRMAAITADLQTVAKNLSVETGRGKSYKAVSERDIIDAVKPLEIKHGVYSYPAERHVLESQILESENEYQGMVTKKTTFYERIKTVYRFCNIDNPAEYIETTTFAEGIDSQDKGSGKAMTYADKYALMKAYKISTGDDPDQTASTEERYTQTALICADCGSKIEPIKLKDGRVWTPADVVRNSQKSYGRSLCRDCMTKINEAKKAAKTAEQEG
jgi:ribosomal protein L34E|nr:MAG TPA: ERF superfamily protein [Caudoviricetes sp.]